MANRLTLRQEDFCIEYLRNGGNGSDAYRVAYNAKNMSSKTVNEKASRLLAQDKIRARIDKSRQNVARRVEVGEAEILQSAAWAMQCDPRRILKADGTLVPPQEWPDEIALAIDAIDVKEEYEDGTRKPATGRISKLKFSSRSVARDQLFRYRGLYEKDNRQKAPIIALLDSLPESALYALQEELGGISPEPGTQSDAESADAGSSDRTTH